MRTSGLLMLVGIALVVTAWPAGQKRGKSKEITQTREVPKAPPTVLMAETDRLVFYVSPLSSKGLLSQQVRDALKSLFRLNRRARIVKLRAFVAGSGDVRRVQAIVSETFTNRKLPLPVLTVVQAGGLPRTGSQVVVESTAVARKIVNQHGLAFISGQASTSDQPLLEVDSLAEKSIASLRTAIQAVDLEPKDVLRATCFLSSLEDIHTVRRRLAAEYPRAALNYVQTQRAPSRPVVECEAVARLRAPVGQPLRLLNPEGLPNSPNYSQIALVSAPRVALSGAQLAFRFQEDDARLAFQRLGKDLQPVGASLQHVVMSSIYPLSRSIGNLARKVRFEFYDKANPPASTMLPFEGLPALDASFAVDVVALPANSQ
jgi:enamine deaminase RidA (YjgF/YER057c/UK114 family)